jgi:hypothetical protein
VTGAPYVTHRFPRAAPDVVPQRISPRVTTPDLAASNGVIHVINKVLIPR